MMLLAREGKLDEVMALFCIMGNKRVFRDRFTFNTLLLALCKAGRIVEAEKLLEKMRVSRRRLNMELAENWGQYFGESAGYQQAAKNGQPHGFGSKKAALKGKMTEDPLLENQIEYFEKLEFKKMSTKFVPAADHVSYTTVLDAYAKSGNWHKAEKLLTGIPDDGLHVIGTAMAKVRCNARRGVTHSV
jgi:pentatricopeptide repeat protein